MSAFHRNTASSYRPANNTGGGSHASVPDISLRNHKRWKSTFDKVIGEFLIRGAPGMEQLAVIVKQVISARLEANPYCQTFKSFQVVADIIGALSSQTEAHALPGPIAFAKSEVPRSHLASLISMGPGRIFTRSVYRIFPVDHNGANSDKEFDVFIIRRGITLWPTGSVQDDPVEGNKDTNDRNNGIIGPAQTLLHSVSDAATSGKRRFEGQGSSHYSPPAQRRRPQMPHRDLTWGKGSNSQPIGYQPLKLEDEQEDSAGKGSSSNDAGKLPLRPVPTGLNPPSTMGGVDELDLFASRRTSSAGFTMPLLREPIEGLLVGSDTPQNDRVATATPASIATPASVGAVGLFHVGTAPPSTGPPSVTGLVSSPVPAAPMTPVATAVVPATMAVQSDQSERAATIDNENINEILKQFTRDAAQRQKDLVTLRARITELETTLSTRDAEIATLRAAGAAAGAGAAKLGGGGRGAGGRPGSSNLVSDVEALEAFLEERQTLVRDQNKLALDRARFAAQVSNWAEKLGQVQQGLAQHMPSRNQSVVEGEEQEDGNAQGLD